MQYILSLDIGTTGTKCILFDENLQVAAESFEKSDLISPSPGIVWQEADDIFGSCIRTISETMQRSDVKPSDVAAIGIDSQSAGIMGVDAEGEAATYYDSWLDTRCVKYMEQMRRENEQRIIEITGGATSYTHGPKVLWWKNEQPEAYKKIEKFVIPAGYVSSKFCGHKGSEFNFSHTVIHFSGFGDNKNRVWSEELLDAFDVDPNKMARISSPFEIIGKLTAEVANMCGLIEGIPVTAGSGDTAAGNFGSAMLEEGTLLDTAGTASCLSSVVMEFKPDTAHQTIVQMPSPIEGVWHPLSYINGGGLCIRWFRDELTGDPAVSYDDLMAEAVKIDAGSEGILFVPHFAGRVYPNNPYVKGSFVGLDWKHNKAHMYRSVLEGIAYEYAYYYDIIKRAHPETDFTKVFATGGGSKSPLFNQIKADVLGLPVTAYMQGETALVGSAVMAGYGCGLFEDYQKPLEATREEGATYHPNMENHEHYKEYVKQYLQVIDLLEPVYRSKIYDI